MKAKHCDECKHFNDEMKCTKCGHDKPATEYHKHSARSTGLAAWCKACCADNMRKQYEKKRDERIAYATERNRANPNRSEIARRHSKRTIDELHDSYVRRKIMQTSRIPYKEIPQGLVDVVRELTKLKRAINEKL